MGMIWIDMEMPKCCDECFALDGHGDYPYCLISQDQRGYTFNVRENRMPSCPLKAQEPLTVEPKRIDLEEETKAWLDKMDAADALANIANICMDWDGYRTVDGLGGLVNEIWAYARYCADSILKAQEPRLMTLEEVNALDWDYCYLERERLPGKEYRGMLGKYIMTCVTWPSITAAKISQNIDNYGKTWRCWTSRPTDEQRKAVKWE